MLTSSRYRDIIDLDNKEEVILMPVLAQFYGIAIRMYFLQNEHNPPHIHAIYNDNAAAIDFMTGEVLEGYSEDDCIPFVGNSTCARITWKNKETCALPNVFRVRFHQRTAQLYAFWLFSKVKKESSNSPHV